MIVFHPIAIRALVTCALRNAIRIARNARVARTHAHARCAAAPFHYATRENNARGLNYRDISSLLFATPRPAD